MAASLRNAGRTFVILTPADIGVPPDDDPYEKNLMETASAMEQALSPMPH
jgi:hypothetical protein